MVERHSVTVVGSGYVGLSLSVLLAQNNDVVMLDIDSSRVESINKRQSTVSDKDIESFLTSKQLTLKATLDAKIAYKNASFIVVATPTDYDLNTGYFDTSSVDSVVEDALHFNEHALVVIKSTIPVGHTLLLQKKFGTSRVIFSPEFLREGQALNDNLYPSRIIIGSHCERGQKFAELLQAGAKKNNIETLFVDSTEAEAVKLFSNTFLAMRVAFFNELDSYALMHNLNTKSIIEGMCLDKRIGKGYNNPSFGYGGYCLPKDTKQLLANYRNTPQTLIEAIISSNETRKDFIADEILKAESRIVGFYRLAMKEGSDNFRSSAIIGVIERVKAAGVKVLLYEPSVTSDEFLECEVIPDLGIFKDKCNLIITNRFCESLSDVNSKVFSRDVFGDN